MDGHALGAHLLVHHLRAVQGLQRRVGEAVGDAEEEDKGYGGVGAADVLVAQAAV